jgi:hypothetical protein
MHPIEKARMKARLVFTMKNAKLAPQKKIPGKVDMAIEE